MRKENITPTKDIFAFLFVAFVFFVVGRPFVPGFVFCNLRFSIFNLPFAFRHLLFPEP